MVAPPNTAPRTAPGEKMRYGNAGAGALASSRVRVCLLWSQDDVQCRDVLAELVRRPRAEDGRRHPRAPEHPRERGLCGRPPRLRGHGAGDLVFGRRPSAVGWRSPTERFHELAEAG